MIRRALRLPRSIAATTAFLTISLLTSAFMNWFNKHIALVER